MRILRFALVMGLVGGMVVAVAGQETAPVPLWAQDSGEIPYVEFDECPMLIPDTEVEGDTLDCGYLTTLEDPFDPASELIEIAFAILYASDDNPAPDPVVYLEGGPGGSGILSIDSWLEHPIREHRDIILVDQRGTGYSFPSLNCEEEETVDENTPEDYDAAVACLDRLLAAGIRIENYNTVTNAFDIADLIETLEVGQANLFGVSYGTRLALAVMRDHPGVVRSTILDSTYPQAAQGYEEQAVHTQRAFDKLFEYCASDAACNAVYPDLAEVFYSVVNELNQNPATLTDYETDEEYELTGDDFLNAVFQALYDTTIIPALPAAIYYAYDGDFEMAMELVEAGPPGLEETGVDYYASYDEETLDDYYAAAESLGDAEGMFYALECQDEIAYNSLDQAYDLAGDLRPEIAEATLVDVEQSFVNCEIWGVAPAPPAENEPVVSDIPTLVLAGDLDPITPPVWGQLAASTLPNSYYYEFSGVGHGVVDAGDCPVSIILQFLDNPARAPDTGCMAAMIGPVFYIRP